MKRGIVCCLAALTASAANAVIWDNFGSWDGNITNGWFAQAQIFAVPADNLLALWQLEMDPASAGTAMTFSIQNTTAGVPNGTMLFSQNFVVPSGGGVISFSPNATYTVGQTLAAVIDFGGNYSGLSVHYTGIDVVPGNGAWRDQAGNWSDFPTLDQKLHAEWRPVPEPCTLIALGAGALTLLRRRRR